MTQSCGSPVAKNDLVGGLETAVPCFGNASIVDYHQRDASEHGDGRGDQSQRKRLVQENDASNCGENRRA